MKYSGFTLWFTGLPCSGKSTLASMTAGILIDRGHKVEVLDGDEIRQNLSGDLGFTKPERDENIRRITYVARLLSRNNVIALVAAISPYRQLRNEARKNIETFVEVYVKCDLAVCAERDIKGHYAKASRGEIPNFTGINDPYERPLEPELIIETDKFSTAECTSQIIDTLTNFNYI